MLYRSHDNLIPGFEQFVASHNQVTLLTAYLKLQALEEINRSNHINQIVVRWQVSDLCGKTPASELEEIWTYCKTNKIKLYRNTRLHMKVLWNNSHEAIVGSANITRNGLGLREGANWEFASRAELRQDDLLYLNTVLLGTDTTLVNEELYLALKQAKEQYAKEKVPEIPEVHPLETFDGKFLTNQLPMFKDIAGMYAALQNHNHLDEHARNCLLHDAALYGMNANMSEAIFYNTLKSNFLNHPFIVAFLEAVRNAEPDPRTPDRPSMQFGPVRIWFANNTTEVPAPRPWELTSYVDVLYNWIQFLSGGEYTWEVPGRRSQILYFNG